MAQVPCAMASDEQPLSDEVRARFHLDEIRAAIAGEFRMPLEWGQYRDSSDPLRLHTRTEEFDPQAKTTIDATITLEPFHYYLTSCNPNGDVVAKVTVTLVTGDGLISAETHGILHIQGNGTVLAGVLPSFGIGTEVSLSNVSGTLDFPIDTSRIHEGALRLQFQPFPSGLRGSLDIVINYFDNEDAYTNYHSGSDFLYGLTITPILEGRFPIDNCDSDSFPIDAQAPEPWLLGESAASLFAQAAGMRQASAFDALWLGGTRTQVRVDYGAPPSGVLCLAGTSEVSSFAFRGTARIQSADGRLDISMPKLQLTTSYQASGGVREVDLGLGTLAPVAAADFSAATGIRGVMAGTHRRLEGGIEVDESFKDTGSESSGYLEVHDADTSELIDCLRWPAAAGAKLNASCFPEP